MDVHIQDKLEGSYTFNNERMVLDFVRNHPQIVDVLREAIFYLNKHFGSHPEVVLDLVSDPEAPDSETLFAYIRTDLAVDDALARLKRFDTEWFLDQFDRTDDLLIFTLEFV